MVNVELEPGTIIRWKDLDYRVLEALPDPKLIDGRPRDLHVEYTAASGKVKDAWWCQEWFRFSRTASGLVSVLRYRPT